MISSRVARLTTATIVATALTALAVIPAASAARRPRPPTTTTPPTTTAPPGLVTPTAPTNLRVTGATATRITVQWDHSQGINRVPGCTLAITTYAVFVDGAYYGATLWGSPVASIGVTPGTTYRVTVQGRDNCTGRLSPMSEPLVYRAPA